MLEKLKKYLNDDKWFPKELDIIKATLSSDPFKEYKIMIVENKEIKAEFQDDESLSFIENLAKKAGFELKNLNLEEKLPELIADLYALAQIYSKN